jgi:hypothetical protein
MGCASSSGPPKIKVISTKGWRRFDAAMERIFLFMGAKKGKSSKLLHFRG